MTMQKLIRKEEVYVPPFCRVATRLPQRFLCDSPSYIVSDADNEGWVRDNEFDW